MEHHWQSGQVENNSDDTAFEHTVYFSWEEVRVFFLAVEHFPDHATSAGAVADV